jgi:glycoprotein-N-acetylgalactosamine 3-beta-galactosyltransferase
MEQRKTTGQEPVTISHNLTLDTAQADDDTYIIMENLKSMLTSYNTSEPIALGCKFSYIVKSGYLSGGAGYVLSKEALHRFVTKVVQVKSDFEIRAGADFGQSLKA